MRGLDDGCPWFRRCPQCICTGVFYLELDDGLGLIVVISRDLKFADFMHAVSHGFEVAHNVAALAVSFLRES